MVHHSVGPKRQFEILHPLCLEMELGLEPRHYHTGSGVWAVLLPLYQAFSQSVSFITAYESTVMEKKEFKKFEVF